MAFNLYQFNHFAFARFNRTYEQEQSTTLFAAQGEARRLCLPILQSNGFVAQTFKS